MKSSSDYNPFAAPAMNVPAFEGHELSAFRRLVRGFHQEARALAGLAAVGSIILMLASSSVDNHEPIIGIVGYGSSVGLVTVWVQITRRKILAVYVLLAIISTVIIVSLVTFPATGGGGLLAAMFLGFAAAQCFRVIRTARRLRAAGIPLTTPEGQVTQQMLERLNNLQGRSHI